MGVCVCGRAYVLVRVPGRVQVACVDEFAYGRVRVVALLRARVRAPARANARDGRARELAHVGARVYVRVGA